MNLISLNNATSAETNNKVVFSLSDIREKLQEEINSGNLKRLDLT